VRGTIIYAKSLLDGAASVAFASSLGIGVSFAALTVLVLQPVFRWGGERCVN
jgi:uncharacterized membrane protein YqgA involved in biofilm formation